MKRQLWKIVLAVVCGMTAQTSFGLGTKFACCRAESVSCLGGGGATIWHRTLRDRALTQADAALRCGFDRMKWNSHSCPASTSCPGDPGGGNTLNVSKVRNASSQNIYVARKYYENNKFITKSWQKVAPGETKTYRYPGSRCLAFAVSGGQDYFDYLRDNDMIVAGPEFKSLRVSKNHGTQLEYWKDSNNWWSVRLTIRARNIEKSMDGFSEEGLRAFLDHNDLKQYDCVHYSSGDTDTMFTIDH